MAQINEQFIQVKTKANFESRLSAEDIKDTSIAFIEDTSEIWAKGKYYPCPDISNLLDKVSAESTYAKLTNTVNSKALSTNPVLNGNDIKLDGFTESEEVNQNLEIETTDTVNQGLGKLQKAIKDNEEVVADTFVVFRNKIGLTENLQYIPEDASKVGNATSVKDAIDYLAGEIPTKVSDLTNDANYITSGNIPVNSVSITGSGNALVDATFTNRTLTITKGEIQSGGISEIPIASSTQLGGIKVGSGLEITGDGVLSTTNEDSSIIIPLVDFYTQPGSVSHSPVTLSTEQLTAIAQSIGLSDNTTTQGNVEKVTAFLSKIKEGNTPVFMKNIYTKGSWTGVTEEKAFMALATMRGTELSMTANIITGEKLSNGATFSPYLLLMVIGIAGQQEGDPLLGGYVMDLANLDSQAGDTLLEKYGSGLLTYDERKAISNATTNIQELTTNYTELEEALSILMASITQLQSSKQDTLVSGTNIKTINNQSIIGSGNIEISEYSLSTASEDTLGGIKIGYTESNQNYPVELNSSGQAYVNVPWDLTYEETSGSVSGGLQQASFIVITQDEYDALQNKDSNTIYFIRG